MATPVPPTPEHRGVYANRTLNLRAIRAIGYDMDYTLVHYRVSVWEDRAYGFARDALAAAGWPVTKLAFDPSLVIRGLVIDLALGNVVKADRFGYVKRAAHGTRLLEFDEQRKAYFGTMVDLSEPRWVFMNTLFSLSDACLYGQLVDLLDRGELPGVMGYADLYGAVRRALDTAHAEGRLKDEILAQPERFVELDPELPLALLDQKEAGKRLLLITNSEWFYARDMMAFAIDPYLPTGMTWRDLFDLVVVAARKPQFFEGHSPLFEIVDESGLLRPSHGGLRAGGLYFGGSADIVEQHLGLSGSEILYVGDHIFADVQVSKSAYRWRTALVLRELEEELAATAAFGAAQARLSEGMQRKEMLERHQAFLRLSMQRMTHRYGPRPQGRRDALEAELEVVRQELRRVDDELVPHARRAGTLSNERWGLLLRAGNDKSHLARQLERHADVYLSRVSNLLYATPYAFLRPPRTTLPHDVDGGS